jgi:hypothetical protein
MLPDVPLVRRNFLVVVDRLSYLYDDCFFKRWILALATALGITVRHQDISEPLTRLDSDSRTGGKIQASVTLGIAKLTVQKIPYIQFKDIPRRNAP